MNTEQQVTLIFLISLLAVIIVTVWMEVRRPVRIFKNDLLGRQRKIRKGFSWIFFWLSGLFGIPCFLYGLHRWGMVNVLFVLANFIPNPTIVLIFSILHFGVLLYLGFKAYRLLAAKLTSDGYNEI